MSSFRYEQLQQALERLKVKLSIIGVPEDTKSWECPPEAQETLCAVKYLQLLIDDFMD